MLECAAASALKNQIARAQKPWQLRLKTYVRRNPDPISNMISRAILAFLTLGLLHAHILFTGQERMALGQLIERAPIAVTSESGPCAHEKSFVATLRLSPEIAPSGTFCYVGAIIDSFRADLDFHRDNQKPIEMYFDTTTPELYDITGDGILDIVYQQEGIAYTFDRQSNTLRSMTEYRYDIYLRNASDRLFSVVPWLGAPLLFVAIAILAPWNSGSYKWPPLAPFAIYAGSALTLLLTLIQWFDLLLMLYYAAYSPLILILLFAARRLAHSSAGQDFA